MAQCQDARALGGKNLDRAARSWRWSEPLCLAESGKLAQIIARTRRHPADIGMFSALAIRTMCEEVQRLRSLDLDATEIEEMAAAPGGTTEYARLMLFLRMARANVDAPEDPRNFDPKSWSDLDCAVFLVT
jgi:hypothetical protein